MTDQSTQAPTEQKPAEAAPKPSLEALYAEYDVEPGAPPNAAPPAVEPTPAANGDTAIRDELATIRKEIAARDAKQAAARDEADLTTAVAEVGKEAGIDGKDSVLRGVLIAKAQEDQRFLTLWQGRETNPTAWKKALKIVSDEVKELFEVPNPQLEENQRAMDESQRAASSTAPPAADQSAKVMQMNEADFSRFWGRLAGRG